MDPDQSGILRVFYHLSAETKDFDIFGEVWSKNKAQVEFNNVCSRKFGNI